MRWVCAFSLLMFVSSSAIAEDIQIVGTKHQTIELAPAGNARVARSVSSSKQITLMQVKLSDSARQKMSHQVEKQLDPKPQFHSASENKQKQLGMNRVPVLDQGVHGACVTFANTAAIDAALQRGDYVSQLCQLQLGRYLERTGYIPSGWDGSWGPMVLSQMSTFGLISKAQEKAFGCGGFREYPVASSQPDTEMQPEEFHQLSEPMNRVGWSNVLDIYQVMTDKIDPKMTLNRVKASLDAGDRLTFGVLLPGVEQGIAGAIGHYHAAYDSWVLTPELAKDIDFNADMAAHELIITGYDDAAVATDPDGHPHKGLLTLRNSWGEMVGDGGNFYMSYDYFMALAVEVQRIRSE